MKVCTRVCIVLASANNGGLEKHVRELSEQLIVMGNHVAVIAPMAFLNTLDTRVEGHALAFENSRYNPLLLWQLLLKIKATNCDIVHAQANKATAMVGLLKPFLKCPIIATLHNIKSNVRPFFRFNAIICVSKQLAQSFKNKNVRVIYNGIHSPTYNSINLKTQFDLPHHLPVICAVGRLVEAKGFDVLLKAVNGLPLSLLIVGDGPLHTSLQQQITQLSPNTFCKLLGYRDDINDLMHAADTVVIASRREGFSYVFNEAALCGTKILSTDVPVANEILPAELIVPIDDVNALATKLAFLLAHPSTWQNLMLPVQAFAQQHLQVTVMAEKTFALYTELLNTQTINSARSATFKSTNFKHARTYSDY